MSYEKIRHRLSQGRPLVVDADTGASFRARGVAIDSPGALGLLLRENPQEVMRHYRAEIDSRVDVLCALTSDTTPRALAEVGMQHRAAALTGKAVDLAYEALGGVRHPVAVAGVLGSEMVSPMAADRVHGELSEHAERLAFSGCQLILARGLGSRLSLMAAVVAAASTELPTWAIVECQPESDMTRGSLADLVASLSDAGAEAVLFEVSSVNTGIESLERTRAALEGLEIRAGVLLAAGSQSLRGFHDTDVSPEQWVERVLDLTTEGARVVGGGAGTTEAHTAALARALGSLHPSLVPQRPDTEHDRGPSKW